MHGIEYDCGKLRCMSQPDRPMSGMETPCRFASLRVVGITRRETYESFISTLHAVVRQGIFARLLLLGLS